MPYSYWVPERIVELFEKNAPLDRDNARKLHQQKIADLKVGLQTGDDSCFTRYWWEVEPGSIATSREETFKGKEWVPFIKGGDAYYSNILHLVNWENDGEEIKRWRNAMMTLTDMSKQSGDKQTEAYCRATLARHGVAFK